MPGVQRHNDSGRRWDSADQRLIRFTARHRDIVESHLVQSSQEPDSPTDLLVRDIRRWLRFVGLAVCAVLLFRLAWGLEAHRRFHAEVRSGLAKGEPASLSEMQPLMVRDHPDAIRIYRMLPAMEWPREFYEVQIQTSPPGLAYSHPAVLQSFIRANRHQIEFLQSAHDTAWLDAPIPIAAGKIGDGVPRENRAFIYELAVAAFAGSDHALAFDYVLDLYRCADLQATRDDSTDAQYGAHNSREQAAHFLELYGGRLAFDPGRSAPARSIPQGKVRHLISRLLDDENWIAQTRHLMLQERARMLQYAAEPFSRGPLDDLVFGPSRRMEHVAAAHWLSLASAAIKEPSLPAARRVLPPTSSYRSDLGSWPQAKAMAFVDQHYRGLAMQRLTAVLLASRLYQTDHGNDPPSLADLVPRYLPNTPRDPFDPAEHGLHMKQGSSGLLLYSVGYDGVDGGGTWRNSLEWWAGDYGLDLSPAAPPPATATTTNSR